MKKILIALFYTLISLTMCINTMADWNGDGLWIRYSKHLDSLGENFSTNWTVSTFDKLPQITQSTFYVDGDAVSRRPLWINNFEVTSEYSKVNGMYRSTIRVSGNVLENTTSATRSFGVRVFVSAQSMPVWFVFYQAAGSVRVKVTLNPNGGTPPVPYAVYDYLNGRSSGYKQTTDTNTYTHFTPEESERYEASFVMPTTTREGYVFDAWYTKSDEEKYNNIRIDETTKTTAAVKEVIAHWMLSPVENLRATQDIENRILIQWKPSKADVSYVVYRSDTNKMPEAYLARPAENFYEDETAKPGRLYYYWVKASDGETEALIADPVIGMCALEQVAAPTISPVDGTKFTSPTRKITIKCATEGATIYYTTDGSTPDETSAVYKAFDISETTTIKAVAYKNGMKASEVVTATIIRLIPVSLNEAVDMADIVITTGGSSGIGEWEGFKDSLAKIGGDCSKSPQIGDEQNTWLKTTVSGKGTFSFWWRVSCERDPSGATGWDAAVFTAPDANIKEVRRDGVTDWEQVTVTFATDGNHALTWIFSKDESNDAEYDDCIWLDGFTWIPVSLPVGTKPIITTQPKSQTVNEGSSVIFSVTASGTEPLCYQWYKDGTAIGNATDSSYSIECIKKDDAGSYTVVISNEAGTVTSDEAVLEVVALPTIITQPKRQTVNSGETVTFSVEASSPTTLSYQWYKDGEPISNATSTTYTINSVQESDAGNYTVAVKNDGGKVISDAAILIVNTSEIVIVTQPKSQTVNEGDSVIFSVEVKSEYNKGKNFTTTLSDTVDLDMVWIESGTYTKGSPDNELGRGGNETQNIVTITNGFWIGRNEVTQAQYETIIGKNPSKNIGANNPVEQISWYDACGFCSKLTEREKAAGRLPEGYEYTLPTEAQWEYACRAGTTTALNSGKDLTSTTECPNMDEVGWYQYNSNKKTHSVGQKKPNAWGLYDMHGNVWEWCLDRYHSGWYFDPICYGAKGGAYTQNASSCRSAVQSQLRQHGARQDPIFSDIYNDVGFRIVLIPVDTQTTTNTSLSYQWYKDGDAISGATDSSYMIENAQLSDAGSYTVTVSNNAGSVTSDEAILTVEPVIVIESPVIIEQPQSQTGNEGDSVTFNVEVKINNSGYENFTTSLPNGVNLDMVWIEPGTFIMGSPSDEIGPLDFVGEDQHRVVISSGYWLGKYEVTQAQYEAIIGENPSRFRGDNNPVEQVSWYDAVSFCEKLTEIEKAAGRLPEGYKYTLPTEAQWEYACRAGTTTAFYNGTNIPTEEQKWEVPCPNADQIAWYMHNSGYTTHPIGQKQPNGWGLYDMYGNVWEWCLDWYSSSYYTESPITDPMGPSTGMYRCARGASWDNGAYRCRSAAREYDRLPTYNQNGNVGFRVALTTVLSYQWYKDGEAISEATESSYTIENAQQSDAGSYTVTVSNSTGSVTSSAATLTVNKPMVSDGTAVRSVKVDGQTATVTLVLLPSETVSVYFVEETVPDIGTVVPSNGGIYTAAKNVIRWSFLDGVAREVSYTITMPSDFSEKVTVSGEVAFDTTVKGIEGETELDFTVKTHPADTNDDFEISMLEVSAYAVAWKQGKSWSREPADIPMNYVARGALIWINGGDYIYDSSKAKPACWVNAVKAASVELASASVPERKISEADGKANVAIEIIPAADISIYLVEEQLPADVTLNVTNISDGGNYIPEKNVIRWSFLDGMSRTLTYTIETEEGFVGTVLLNGEVMFDEETFTIEGDTEAIFRPIVSFVVEDDGEGLVLNFAGTLYESDDAISWRVVEGAKAPFKVDTSKGKKFYRCAQ